MPAHSPPPPIASIAENIRLRPKASCIGRSENCSATVTTDMDENDVMVPAAQPIHMRLHHKDSLKRAYHGREKAKQWR